MIFAENGMPCSRKRFTIRDLGLSNSMWQRLPHTTADGSASGDIFLFSARTDLRVIDRPIVRVIAMTVGENIFWVVSEVAKKVEELDF